MTLSPAQAEALLAAHEVPGEAWGDHCRQVAKVARRLGEGAAALDQARELGARAVLVTDPPQQQGEPQA
ncbi:MAG: hypothetical protein ACPGQD_08255, partial [Planctomycetota bacterium]